eukprot:Hpha_TRINITY_DN13408_c0_g2::TRINITY_DN13408_c0_g2_i1::g.130970::m.130970/K10746/EXO1; exonuclease 1
MGIQGLLPALKPVTERTNVDRFAGKKVGVDAYTWVHKACHFSAYELSLGIPTGRYLSQILSRARMLRDKGVEPLFVFDGKDPGLKGGTNQRRLESRQHALARGRELLAQGEHSRARDYYARALDVTPELALSVLRALRAANFDCMVAPYEADAQLAHLAKSGAVHAVLTEDSDLLAYGTSIVFFKMDPEGNGDLIEVGRVREVAGMEAVGQGVQFLDICILAGCDYLPSLPGVGIKKASKLLAAAKGSVDAVLQTLQSDAAYGPVPPGRAAEYLSDFRRARAGFLTHVVYDPSTSRAVRFTESVTDLGDLVIDDLPTPATASAIASADLHPVTLKPYVGEFDCNVPLAGGKRAREEQAGAGAAKKQPTLLQKWSVSTAEKKQPRAQAAPPAPVLHMEVGARVRRNALHWKWGDQDGGDGRLGTVLELRRGTVRVRWDAYRGEPKTYKYGIGGVKEVQVAQSAAEAQKLERSQSKLAFRPPAPPGEEPDADVVEVKKVETITIDEEKAHLELRSRFWFEFDPSATPERKALGEVPVNTPPPPASKKSPKRPQRPVRRVEDLVGYASFSFAYPEEEDGSIAETLSDEESEESGSYGVKEVAGGGDSETEDSSSSLGGEEKGPTEEEPPEEAEAAEDVETADAAPSEPVAPPHSEVINAATDAGPHPPLNPFLKFALGKKAG